MADHILKDIQGCHFRIAGRLRSSARAPLTLDELLVGITPENLHEEIPTAYPVGNEAI